MDVAGRLARSLRSLRPQADLRAAAVGAGVLLREHLSFSRPDQNHAHARAPIDRDPPPRFIAWIERHVPRRAGMAAAVLILLARTKFGARLLHPLACAGRMAFSNYLTQSLIMTAIFYGGRGPGLFGTMNHAALVPIVAAIWIGQLIFSTLWLRWFRYGPFEWGWRCLTYDRRLPIIR